MFQAETNPDLTLIVNWIISPPSKELIFKIGLGSGFQDYMTNLTMGIIEGKTMPKVRLESVDLIL